VKGPVSFAEALGRMAAARLGGQATRSPYLGYVADHGIADPLAEARLRRHYKASPLPVISESSGEGADREVLLAVYGQASEAWRVLTEVRFKLLAIVPSLTGLGLFGLLGASGGADGTATAGRVAGAVFGLLISFGLYVYDRRNSDLYNDLISRGRRAELELGVDTGVFRGRPNPRAGSIVKHGSATGLIYWTVIVAWAAAPVFILLG